MWKKLFYVDGLHPSSHGRDLVLHHVWTHTESQYAKAKESVEASSQNGDNSMGSTCRILPMVEQIICITLLG